MKTDNLPLINLTPERWAVCVLKNPTLLLGDQVYLEKKAANNALEFLNLWPGTKAPAHWLLSVAAIARDETLHMQSVLKLLKKRGGELAPVHKNPYAHDLRKLIRKGQGHLDLIDRLMISALIEARSCERFIRLSQACQDAELSGFYKGLVASENGHYQMFLEMAKEVAPPQEVGSRWEELLKAESQIVAHQPFDFKIHGGWD